MAPRRSTEDRKANFLRSYLSSQKLESALRRVGLQLKTHIRWLEQDPDYKAKFLEVERQARFLNVFFDTCIESIRNLRTALHFGMMDVKNNVILITGPGPSVGKSFASINLAAVLAANDKKVLLIDADLRRGHLHESFGLERENGLTDFVSGSIKIGDVFKKTNVPGVDTVTTATRCVSA